MYKIDDEFRPPGRVFVKATHENPVAIPDRKSNMKQHARGPPITTNLDDRNIRFQHEVKHEKTIEAMITEYPANYAGYVPASSSVPPPPTTRHSESKESKETMMMKKIEHHNGGTPVFETRIPSSFSENISSLQSITRNNRVSTEVLGSSFETTKTSQRAPDGHRRITTHIVRKVTTMSRAEEQATSQDMLRTAKDVRTTKIGYETTQAIEPKRPKV